MNDGTKYTIVALVVVTLLVTIALFMYDLVRVGLIVLLVSIVIIAIVLLVSKSRLTEDDKYNNGLKRIFRIFKSVLVEIEKIPKIKNITTVVLNSIDSLIDIQNEVRKPIYYKKDIGCCDFFIITNEELCTFTIKKNNSVMSPLERIIEEIEKEKNNPVVPKGEDRDKFLEELEKTTIIKITSGDSYKISPMKGKDLREAKKIAYLESLEKDMLPKIK